MVDELRTGLELATDEELETLTEILFQRKFNPLDYVCTPEIVEVQSRDRQAQLDAIEERFRFLAADGFTVLRRKTGQISYRQVLMQVCRYLKISYSQTFSTEELEAEIFLHILNAAWKKLPPAQQRVLTGQLQEALSHAQLAKQLPPAVHKDPIALALKGGSAFAVSSVVGPWLLQQITRQFALHAATYQVATEALVRGGVTAATQLQSKIALQTASRGMAMSAARYGAVRSVFAFLGPALWMWFFADLGWRSIATNYSRVIPVIFTLAQIRLTRSTCFVGT
ncbi:hypothetical protein H6G89_13855 [Oscillatoria sp. FACHB-1407]|uniref:YaaW family protein n=1 Tax=Oscillatoria sp. FACHB-1407 TaxID=2692847 RepID=UPI0016870062|nr:hypothetical protein [Oscillatoria sp. FACHB-1407]MBD2462132.1 hypothetical protein [Oscillatoria sp. FACHB-1407]